MEIHPVFSPLVLGTEERYLKEALDTSQLSGTTELISRFESQFAEFTGTQYAVAVSNGTAALHAALLALNVKEGDEVILPSFTIISDALTVVLCGAKPVFVDVRPSDWCLETKNLNRVLSKNTVGIIPVHIYGHSCEMDEIFRFAKQHQLWVLEDAAQAHGGKWKDKPLGSMGKAGCFSFYANKLITTGEGGAVTTNDRALYDKLLQTRNLGFDPDPTKRFVHSILAHNFRMSSLQAAMGLGQLEKVTFLLDRRRKLREMYRDAFGVLQGFSLPHPHELCTPSFWACTVLLDENIRLTVPDLQQKLAACGIETRRFFYPLHRQPVLSRYHGQSKEEFIISDGLFDRGLYLPSSSHLTWDQVRYIVRKFKETISAEGIREA